MLLFIIIVLSAVAYVVAQVKRKFAYWPSKNIPYLKPTFPFGNFQSVFSKTESVGQQLTNIYRKFKKDGEKHVGIYLATIPTYLPINLDIIKTIMTKEFSHFNQKGNYINEKDDPLSAHLLAIGGLKWKNLRTKLSPTFTSGKMRMMFSTLEECAKMFEEKIRSINDKEIDISEELGRFSTEVVSSCAFGIDADAIQDDNSLFRKHAQAALRINKFTIPLKQLIVVLSANFARAIGLVLTPKDTIQFFLSFVKNSIEYREKNNVTRKDFLQILINAKNNNDDIDHHDGSTLTIEEMAAQCFVFFVAGSATSSTTMAFALYEMSVNQEIQNKVREEMNGVLTKHNGQLSYNALAEMKYLDQVVSETLRKYPPIEVVTRVCVDDFKMPGTDLIFEKGTQCMIPIMALHYDEEYYPEPNKFDPDRFTDENKQNIPQYAYLPFGEGPRFCIGSRFGLMQVKTGLIHLLKNWRFTLNSKTKQPLKLNPRTFVAMAEGGIWLDRHEV